MKPPSCSAFSRLSRGDRRHAQRAAFRRPNARALNQYLARMMTAFETIKHIHKYRTPRTLRAFSDFFILLLPILYGPYFAYLTEDFSPELFFVMPILFALIFTGLANIQDDLENPFDLIGEDDVAIDPDRYLATLDIDRRHCPRDLRAMRRKARRGAWPSRSSIPRYRRPRRKGSAVGRFFGFLAKLVLALILFSILWVIAYRFVPPPTTATMIGDMVAGRGATRDWMSINQIDRDMVRAAIGAEDSKFCQHDGFDWDSIQDAAKRNASGGRIRGGSTISQQTAKTTFLWNGGGYARKGVEAWFTFLIENLWGKRRIMEVYLNNAETGIGTYGVNAGSQRYFGHDASAMSATRRRGSPRSCRCPRSAARSRPRASPAAMATPLPRASAWSAATASTPASTRARRHR